MIALSGGGSLPDQRLGKPRIFVAHGRRDQVIPIAVGGDELVRQLRSDGGYRVTYHRFDGGHRVVPAIARAAVAPRYSARAQTDAVPVWSALLVGTFSVPPQT